MSSMLSNMELTMLFGFDDDEQEEEDILGVFFVCFATDRLPSPEDTAGFGLGLGLTSLLNSTFKNYQIKE